MSLWVVKVGTSLLRGTNERTTFEVIQSFSSCLAESKNKGDQVILVTSGAVGLGCHRLGIKERPKNLVFLQAVAAIGQGHLMSLYEKAMESHGYHVAQVLLTRKDLSSRNGFNNASKTLKQLLKWDVLPIINENDTLSSEELRYGDNDTLSALVATAVAADQLILLTDIDRLYSSDPKSHSEAIPITDVHDPSELKNLGQDSVIGSGWGTGGITTKLSAARIATSSGITVQLADGRNPEVLKELLNGSRGGTVFHPSPQPLGSRKSWLAHALEPIGTISLDKGASDAIQNRGASLLLVGIKDFNGDFGINQPVRILNDEGVEIAKGISSMSSKEIFLSLQSSCDSKQSPVVIHRDVLVLTSESLCN